MRAARRRPNLPFVAVNTRSIFYRIFYRTVRHEGLLEGTPCQRRYAKLQVCVQQFGRSEEGDDLMT